MPSVMPISDLQRNMRTVAERCSQTQEPIYLTRNGHPKLVIMDAEAYDKERSLKELVYEREMRIQRRAIEGHAQIEQGEYTTLAQARALRNNR